MRTRRSFALQLGRPSGRWSRRRRSRLCLEAADFCMARRGDFMNAHTFPQPNVAALGEHAAMMQARRRDDAAIMSLPCALRSLR